MGKNIEGKEALVKQIQEEGHLIGNHTYNHVQLDKISKEAAKEEIETTNQKIFEITGVYPAWLRPPYGEWRIFTVRTVIKSQSCFFLFRHILFQSIFQLLF